MHSSRSVFGPRKQLVTADAHCTWRFLASRTIACALFETVGARRPLRFGELVAYLRRGGRLYAKEEQEEQRARIVLRLPDLDHSKFSVLNSLSSPRSRRNYLESLGLAAATINQRLVLLGGSEAVTKLHSRTQPIRMHSRTSPSSSAFRPASALRRSLRASWARAMESAHRQIRPRQFPLERRSCLRR